MKVKELHKTVNVAWSPLAQYPILLAAGTAAQQLDASFDTNASLDLYSLNLQQPGYDMQLNVSVPSDQRFHKIIWGSYGNNPAGMIVGGCDYGKIKIYSAAKMLANDGNCLISSPERHKGPVRAMDFNPFQPNLLATGATESEIYIWDLNNTNQPMTPGSKSMPAEDVQHIAWNKQVQHILASTFSQRCVIWDLKKNEAIIKLTDVNSRVRWKSVQWHPDVATQLCLASEEDQSPIIELWDLRFATSPLKTLQNHQRGVLSIAWNPHDSDLLLSCAKDNRILCWNPNSNDPNGEVICELAQTNQWNFDVSWCPRHPGLVVGTSFDGLASVYSLLGGSNQGSVETSNKIVDSFPGMDPFTQPPPSAHTEAAAILKKAPKWLKKPFGASFGFGGKLTIFENEPVEPNMPPNSNRKVFVSQVITNQELIQRSNELEAAVKSGQYSDFCKGKADNAPDDHKRKVWNCIGAYFGENVTQELLELLGFNIDEMSTKLNQLVPQQEIDAVTEGVSNLNNQVNGNAFDGSAAFDAIAEQEQRKSVTPSKSLKKSVETNFRINTADDDEGLITQAILLGNVEAAVALCFENKRYADAVILSMAGGPELLAQTQYRYFSEHTGALNSLINSLVSENWVDVVRNCDITCWKEALIGVFTHTAPEERNSLCDILGDRLAQSDNANLHKEAQICYICSGNLNKTIEAADSDIQETVELVTMMQKALEFHTTRKVNVEGNIAAVLTRYAEMLAAEGDLDAALNYLGNSQEPRITMLRDRLYKALGHISMEPQRTSIGRNAPYQNQNIYSQNQPLGRKSIPGGPQSMFAPVQQSIPAPIPSQQPTWNTAPTKQAYTGAANPSFGGGVVTSQPYGGSTFTPTIPAPLQTQATSNDPYGQYGQTPLTPSVPPPPPTAATSGSRPSSVGPHSRSKYILDPSVKSGPSYGSSYSQTQYGVPTQPQTFPAPGGFPAQAPYQQSQPVGGYGGYGSGGAQNTIYNPAEPELQQQQRAAQPSILNPSPVKAQSLYDPTVATQQIVSQGGMAGQVPSQPPVANYSNENTYQPGSQTSGWNDPPISSKTAKAQPVMALFFKNEMCAEHAGSRKWKAKYAKGVDAKPKTEFQRQDPIMHPLRGAPPPEPTVYQQDPGYHQHQQTYQDPQAMYNQYNQNIPGMQQYNRPNDPLPPVQPAQIVRAPEPEKPKAPIPEEHIILQRVFNELKERCYNNARNPQAKRKLDEVTKKLEVFYDYLREQKISQSTLQGLHQICNLIQNEDYQASLKILTQLVSGPDFSQIAPFMPGIKVLIQLSVQMGVYVNDLNNSNLLRDVQQ
ncbi:protein transport protein Sec31A isoform X3 [Nasonia vitripennis]|nr:protein transport protein Sec31A isoform X3 [Nasonia vitripennis]